MWLKVCKYFVLPALLSGLILSAFWYWTTTIERAQDEMELIEVGDE